jgi:DMSO/TMAO reductase YedYZ molybdopterin-dependent catalytic subunit
VSTGRDKRPWTLERLRALPQAAQITRHICIEGWSAIGQWSGVPLKLFCRPSAPTCRRNTSASSARPLLLQPRHAHRLHPQTILALDFGKEPLPTQYGFPLKVRVPTKLGFKNPKHCGRSS